MGKHAVDASNHVISVDGSAELDGGDSGKSGALIEVMDRAGNRLMINPSYARELVATSDHVIRLNNGLVIDTAARYVTQDDQRIELTRREFDLLEHLARHPHRVFSKAQLLAAVWESDADWQSEATVTEHVRRLRRKLGQARNSAAGLMTVWGVGYRYAP